MRYLLLAVALCSGDLAAQPTPQPQATPASTAPSSIDPATLITQAMTGMPGLPPLPPSSVPTAGLQRPEVLAALHAAERAALEAWQADQAAVVVRGQKQVLEHHLAIERKLLAAGQKLAETAETARRDLAAKLKQQRDAKVPQPELDELMVQLLEAEERARNARREALRRQDQVTTLTVELDAVGSELVVAETTAEELRQQTKVAEAAAHAVQSPFTWANIGWWWQIHGFKLLAIILGVALIRWLILSFSQRLIPMVARSASYLSEEERTNRGRTLISVLQNAASLGVLVLGLMMLCEEFGIGVGPLVGGAAVIGLAVAFGAQNLIRDYFSGFVMLLENQYKHDDWIRIGDIRGQVERITLRMTVLRDMEGSVHFIPNGKIESLTNQTHGWSRALFDVAVSYHVDVDLVMKELIELASALRRDPAFENLILEDAEMLGVDALGESVVVVKFYIKTRPLKQWLVKRELLRRIKRRFDELGIAAPYPTQNVLIQQHDPQPLMRVVPPVPPVI